MNEEKEQEEEQEETQGLEHLSDEELAEIVRMDLNQHNELQDEGSIALVELKRRDANYDDQGRPIA